MFRFAFLSAVLLAAATFAAPAQAEVIVEGARLYQPPTAPAPVIVMPASAAPAQTSAPAAASAPAAVVVREPGYLGIPTSENTVRLSANYVLTPTSDARLLMCATFGRDC